jgi:hypothetical protein
MTEVEIAWLAGLLEGEGCFSVTQRLEHNRLTTRVSVVLVMTDEDVVYRAQALTGLGRLYYDARDKVPNNKPVYIWRVAVVAEVVPLLQCLLPYMGHRRTARINQALAVVEVALESRRRKHGTRECYEYERCRCEKCCTAKARVNARRIRKKVKLDASGSSVEC